MGGKDIRFAPSKLIINILKSLKEILFFCYFDLELKHNNAIHFIFYLKPLAEAERAALHKLAFLCSVFVFQDEGRQITADSGKYRF